MKIKFYHIFFCTTLLFFFHFSVNAQKFTASIHGRILNNDGKPAQSVTVELQRLNKLTFSDNNGFFILSHLQPGNDSLIISSIEFKTFA